MRRATIGTPVVVLAIALQMLLSDGSRTPARAAWLTDGSPVCTKSGFQIPTTIVSDGANGAIVFWEQGLFNGDTFGQRVSSNGEIQWGADGIRVCSGNWRQVFPTAVSAPDNGAVVFWADDRSDINNLNIYAQRLNGLGAPQWTECGVAMSTAAGSESGLIAISDRSNVIGRAGWIVLWTSYDFATEQAQYRLQHVEQDGDGLWTTAAAGGVALATGITNITSLNSVAITNDGISTFTGFSQGAVVAWAEKRNPGTTGYDIYARRISSAGAPQWTGNGVLVSGLGGDQFHPSIVHVGGGNTIVAWGDGDISVQKLNSSGAPQWAANGLPICQAPGGQVTPKLVGDGAGGVIAVWIDGRTVPAKLFAQRLDGNGQRLWMPADGIPVCTASGQQHGHAVVSDGAGGVIVSWRDRRGVDDDIYGQRIDGNGNLLWPSAGLPFTRATGNQENVLLTSDGLNGAIAAWRDFRIPGSNNDDIYANRLFSTFVDVPAAGPREFGLAFVSSNPAKGDVRMQLDLPKLSLVGVSVLDAAGRRVRLLSFHSRYDAGRHLFTWDGANGAGVAVAPGVYFVRVQAGTSIRTARVVLLH